MKNIYTSLCIFYLIASLQLISFSVQIKSNFKKTYISSKVTDDSNSNNSNDQVVQQLDSQIKELVKQRDGLIAKIDEINNLQDSESVLSEEEILELTSNLNNTIKALNDSIENIENEKSNIIQQRKDFQNDPKQNSSSVISSPSNSVNIVNTNFIQFKDDSSTSSKKEAASYASACLQGVLSAIPGSFCYKKDGDAGVIPTGCPDGYFRSLALCYENCRSGYKFVAGVCWEKNCDSGYTDFGLTCTGCHWKGWRLKCKTYAKDSYMSSSITNFSDRIPCDEDHYKSGALCYRDCNKNGMVNCGIVKQYF